MQLLRSRNKRLKIDDGNSTSHTDAGDESTPSEAQGGQDKRHVNFFEEEEKKSLVEIGVSICSVSETRLTLPFSKIQNMLRRRKRNRKKKIADGQLTWAKVRPKHKVGLSVLVQ